MRPDASKRLAAAAPKKGPNPVVIGAVIAAVMVVGVVVAILLIAPNIKKDGTPASSRASSNVAGAPAGVIGSEDGGIVVNAAAAKSNAPTLDVYEDFQCPACGQMEKTIGAQMALMAKAGEIKLVVHTLSFLDDNLPASKESSARSANAAACAADAGKFLDYHSAVFAAQPAQEGDGYTDAQLKEFATTSGITGAALTTWQNCTSSGRYAKYVTAVQKASSKAGINTTPTIKLNGNDITKTLATPDVLVAAVKDATK